MMYPLTSPKRSPFQALVVASGLGRMVAFTAFPENPSAVFLALHREFGHVSDFLGRLTTGFATEPLMQHFPRRPLQPAVHARWPAGTVTRYRAWFKPFPDFMLEGPVKCRAFQTTNT